MEEYIKWLENKIEVCLEDKDLQREHWAFFFFLKKYRELALRQPPVSRRSEVLAALSWVSSIGELFFDSSKTVEDMVDIYLKSRQ